MKPTDTFILPISPTYIRHWGLREAVRELLQNALDSPAEFEYDIAGSTLIISNPDTQLQASDLVLGTSTKQDDKKSIGQFGEGFKLALSVLAREHREIVVYNGSKIWLPAYKHNDQFGCEVLCIDEFEFRPEATNLDFVLRNLTDEEIATIVADCLFMHDRGATLTATQGQILLDEPGRLYINGLFITETGLKYGYNIKPAYLKLERDRQTVSDFDLQWETSKMWTEQEDLAAQIADDVAANVSDVSYLHANSMPATKAISNACASKFTQEFGPVHAVASQREANTIIESGGKAAVVCDTYRTQIITSELYSPKSVPKADTPAEILEKFLINNKKHMRRSAIAALKLLIIEAQNWSNNL